MREIKFRAWNKNHKIMHQPNIDTFVSLSGSQIASANLSINNTNDIELMQYIGLKDNNRKEIYEGDIFREDETMGIVKFRNGSFKVVWSGVVGSLTESGWDEDSGGYGEVDEETFDEIYADKIEILGNIYENPELLNDVKSAKEKKNVNKN